MPPSQCLLIIKPPILTYVSILHQIHLEILNLGYMNKLWLAITLKAIFSRVDAHQITPFQFFLSLLHAYFVF